MRDLMSHYEMLIQSSKSYNELTDTEASISARFKVAKQQSYMATQQALDAVHKCSRQLERAVASYNASVDEIEKDLCKQPDWWTKIDFLSTGYCHP